MFTKIAIENFKGIHDKVEIELRPITLLFGSNSSGKSTIIHAFHYLKEIIENGNFNPDHTTLGGDLIDLGGFQNLVYKQKFNDLSVKLRLTLDVSDIELPEELLWSKDLLSLNYSLKEGIKPTLKSQDLTIEEKGRRFYDSLTSVLRSVSLGLSIKWFNEINYADGEIYEIFANDIILARIKLYMLSGGDKNIFPNYALSFINFEHPILSEIKNELAFQIFPPTLKKDILGKYESDVNIHIGLPKQYNILPNIESINDYDRTEGVSNQFLEGDDNLFINLILNLIANVHKLFCAEFRNFRYIGPLREIPPRNYIPNRFVENSKWYNGLAAWDSIYAGFPSISIINEWLNQLKIGYELTEFIYNEVPVGSKGKSDKTTIVYRSLLNELIDQIDEASDPLQDQFYRIIVGLNELSQKNKAFDEVCDELQYKIFGVIEEYRKKLSDIDDALELNDNLLVGNKGENDLVHKRVYLVDKETGVKLLPHDIGVGISQIIPVIVAALSQYSSILTIEQPEIHTHPELEVELADLFISEINKRKNVIYLLETHGEHFLLRLLKRIRNNKENQYDVLKTEQLSVYFFNRTIQGLMFIKTIIDKKGRVLTEWPKGFFEERISEVL